MKKFFLLGALLIGGGIAVQGLASGHGGTYRGPGDTVPPGAGGGGGGGGGPATPGPGGPSTPGPSGPSTPGPATPGAPAGAPAPAGGSTPTTGGETDSGPDLTVWNFWWGFNKDPYLNLRAKVRGGGTVTGSDDFFLGHGQQDNAKDSLAPTEEQIRNQVVPALLETLKNERQNDVVTGCLVALAKIGDTADEGTESEFRKVISGYLNDPTQEIAETAAVALGILGDPASIPMLVSIMNDGPEARKAIGATEVPRRTRAFGAYGLGLIGYYTSDNELRKQVAEHLVDVLESPHFATRDLKVAAMTSFGLIPIDPVQETPVLSDDEQKSNYRHVVSRQAQIEYLMQYFDDANAIKRKDEYHYFVRAHAPRAMAKLLQDTDEESFGELRTKVVDLLLDAVKDKTRRKGYDERELEMAATLALGQIGTAADDGKDGNSNRIRAALQVVADKGEQQSRRFALISLAQTASRPGTGDDPWGGRDDVEKDLVERMSKGQDQVKPWAGLAIGVLNEALAGHSQTASPAVLQALRAKAADCRRPPEIGAYALGLGLSKDNDKKTVEMLVEKLDYFTGQDDVRGQICVALGLIEDKSVLEGIKSILETAKYRPELLKQAAIGLGLMGDKAIVGDLVEMLKNANGMASQAAIASALGQIGDQTSIDPLIGMVTDKDLTASARGFAAVALGIVCAREPLPWNSKISVNLNYRANTVTLTGQGLGILDIL